LNYTKILPIIAVIIALPSFLGAIFSDTYRPIALLALLLVAVLVAVWWILTRPLWTILEFHRTVEIKKLNGSLANNTKKMIMRANHQGLTEFMHRNIRSDGSIGNFKLNSVRVRPSSIEKIAGEYIIHERFEPIGRWQSRSSCLTYNLINSYPKNTETSTYIPDYYTKQYRIEIYFPAKRPARNQRAYAGLGAETKELNRPSLSSDGTKILWEMKNLKPGKYYSVKWNW